MGKKKKAGALELSEWCPLFGILPSSPYPPSKPTSRCIELIQNARQLWGVPFLNGIPTGDYLIEDILSWLSDSTPYLEYPKERILTARIIFDSDIHVWQYSIIQDARKDWYEKDNGEFAPVNTMASVWETAVEYTREYIQSWCYVKHRDGDPDYAKIDFDFIESMPAYAILAIHVISAAKGLLNDILFWKENEDSIYIRQELQEATDLLRKAEELSAEEEIKTIKKEKNDSDFYAKKYLDHQSKRSHTIKTLNIKKSIKGWENLKQVLPDVIKKRPKKNNSEIADALMHSINYEKEYGIPELDEYKLTWKKDTLRKKIAKTR